MGRHENRRTAVTVYAKKNRHSVSYQVRYYPAGSNVQKTVITLPEKTQAAAFASRWQQFINGETDVDT